MSVEAKFDLRHLTKIQRQVLSIGLEKTGKQTVELASQLAPKDTKALSESGKWELEGYSKVIVSFGNDLPDGRAPAQEYGTVDIPAQPYLGPAVKEIDVAKNVADSFKKFFNT